MNKDALHTDEELVRRIKSSDDAAFNVLIERYKKMGFSLAHHMTGSIEDAEDISQDAFVIVYEQIAKFRGESSFKTWFYKIVLNLCRRHYKKNRLASVFSIHSLFHKEGEEKEMSIPVESNPESELLTKQMGGSIMAAITKLSAKQREVFVMKHIKGLKISEIAEIMGCAEGTIKVHLFRAIRELQKTLKGVYHEM